MRFPKGPVCRLLWGPCEAGSEDCACSNGVTATPAHRRRLLNHFTAICWQLVTPNLPRWCPARGLSSNSPFLGLSPGSSTGTRSQTSPGVCLEACTPCSCCKEPSTVCLGGAGRSQCSFQSGLFDLFGVWDSLETKSSEGGRHGGAVGGFGVLQKPEGGRGD